MMAEIKGQNVIAPVVPFDTTDVHPSHEARYGKGGYRTVATTAERDAIPAPRREAGMLVFVTDDGKAYQLGSDLETWTEFTAGDTLPAGTEGDVLTYTSGEWVAAALSTATESVLGGVKIGSGVTITDGVISVSTDYAAATHSHTVADIDSESATVGYVLTADGEGGASWTAVSGDYLPLAGGELDQDATILVSDGTSAAEIAGGSLNVALLESDQHAAVEYTGFTVHDGEDSASLTIAGVTFSDGTTQTTAAAAFDQSLNEADDVQFNSVTAYAFEQPSSTLNVYGVIAGTNNNLPQTLYYNTGITFADLSEQTTAWTGTVDAANVTGLGAVATSNSYDDLDDLPTLGTAAAADIGTGSTQVAAGDHTHTQLHDRSHAITSTSDHTATNWRLFHSNGSGHVVELAFGNSGQALISNGASAAPSWGQAGSTSATDLTSGTLSDSRLSDNARAAINLYLWSSFR